MAGFIDMLAGAFGGQQDAQRQAEEVGLPPLTIQDHTRRINQGGVLDTAAGEGTYPKMGMEAFPFGPGSGIGPRVTHPLVPYAGPGALTVRKPPLQGELSGGLMTPVGARPGLGRGNTYDSTGRYRDNIVPYQAQGTVQGGELGPAGAGAAGRAGNTYDGSVLGRWLSTMAGGGGGRGYVPGSQGTPAGAGAGGPRMRRTNPTGQPGPDGGPIPMGGRVQGSSPPSDPYGGRTFVQRLVDDLNPAQRLGVAMGATGVAGELGSILSRIFGGETEAQAQQGGKIPWPDQGGSGGGGGGSAFRMPRSYMAELKEMIPSVDYENLPRPPYEQVYEQMKGLAPDAPEERNFLDKLPANAKNILGFGILLGPVGLLLGAGMGMSENQSIDRAQQEKFKQESRQHLREMLGFQIDWGKAERAMALEEQEGARDQAMGMLETDLALQNHELGLMKAQDDMATNASRRAAIGRDMGGGQFDIDKLFERAMMMDPAGTMQVWEGLRSADDAPMGLSGDQADTYNQMLKAAVVRALYE